VSATLGSESESDAFFAALKTKLEGAAVAQHAYIDAQCRYYPCKASDPAPCADPYCQERRARVDARLRGLLDEIPSLRAQVRIVAP
jgi:hypothetical protein